MFFFFIKTKNSFLNRPAKLKKILILNNIKILLEIIAQQSFDKPGDKSTLTFEFSKINSIAWFEENNERQ